MLHPDINGGSLEGILAVHSLSKRSNLAGYRCAFVAGDPAVVGELLAVRKNLGLMMPGPQQRAMVAALDDDEHVAEQHARYAARRTTLRATLESAGFRIDHSEAALYLWATRDEPCWDTVAWLAERGVLVAPGPFYGPAGDRHVRVAFTATDERVAAALPPEATRRDVSASLVSRIVRRPRRHHGSAHRDADLVRRAPPACQPSSEGRAVRQCLPAWATLAASARRRARRRTARPTSRGALRLRPRDCRDRHVLA